MNKWLDEIVQKQYYILNNIRKGRSKYVASR